MESNKELIAKIAAHLMHGLLCAGETITPEYENKCIEYAIFTVEKAEQYTKKKEHMKFKRQK